LSTGDPDVDSESGHPIAYQRILEHAQTFEIPPIFIKEDAVSITNDPKMSESVPSWMCIAERIATGSRKRVPKDGPDTWNSDDEAKTDIEADVEKGMYTAEMDPKFGPKTITAQEAARQCAAANALKASLGTTSASGFTTSTSDVSSDFGNSIISSRVSSPQQSQQVTPSNSDDDDGTPEDQKEQARHAKKVSVPRCTSAPGARLPQKRSGSGVDGDPAARLRAAA
jgi:hypothetical protein